MKDGFLLLLAGVAAAAAAWVFWRATGQWGFAILQTIAFGTLLLDNRRLRQRVRNLTKDN